MVVEKVPCFDQMVEATIFAVSKSLYYVCIALSKRYMAVLKQESSISYPFLQVS